MNISDNIVDRTNILKGRTGIIAKGNLTNSALSGTNDFNIDNNRLWNLNMGIHTYNTSGRFANVESNDIYISYLTTQSTSFGIKDENNSFPFFHQNKVSSTGFSLAQQPFIGLYSSLSNKPEWFCNRVKNTGSSMYIKGFTPAHISGNVFNNAYDAFTMGSNAVIGPQGNSGNASDNKWIGNFNHSKTFTINTGCNGHSSFFMRTGNLYFPQASTNLTASVNPVGEEYNISAFGLNEVLNPGPALHCPSFVNLPLLQLMQKTVREQIDFDKFDAHSKWISKKYVYDYILEDSSLLNDPIIDSFALAGTSSYYYFSQIEHEIKLNNLSQAISLSNSFTPSNLPEENYQYFYKIYATFFGVHQLLQTDYDKLVEIAEQCPLDGGKAVFESRALRDFIDKQIYSYDDICEEIAPKSYFESTDSEFVGLFLIYPNPNNGNFVINNKTGKSGLFKLFDVLGQEVYNISVENKEQKHAIIDVFESGIYLYEFILENGAKKNGKISIQK